MRKRVIIIGTVVFLISIGLSGCYDTQLSKGQSEDNSNDATVLTMNVGETAKGKDLEITVKSASKMQSYNWTGGATGAVYREYADNGKIFVIISVKIKQIGSGSEMAYPGEFWIVDANNYKYDYEGMGTYQYGGALEGTTLYQNLQVEGNILFQIPDNVSGLKVQYNFASFWDEPKLAEWVI